MKTLKPERRGWDKILAVSAVLLGVCVFFSWLGWERWRVSPSMHMRRHMVAFLELNQSLGIAGLEKFEGRAGETQDWLFLHGMEGVLIPEVFAGVKVLGARVVQWNGASLALFPTVALPGLLVVAEEEALALPEEGAESGRVTLAPWSGAWASAGRYKVLWMVQAEADVLERYLKGATDAQ
jgi:hypothetical protein